MPRDGADPITGEPLAELVRQFNLSNAIMMRLTRVIDRAALTAIMTGVKLDLTTVEAAEVSAKALEATIGDLAVKVVGAFGRIEREARAAHRAYAPR